MSNFRSKVCETIKECCNDVDELDINHTDYGYITLKELKIDSSGLLCIRHKLSSTTGMSITNEISNKWVTISDIENTLSDFFKL